MCQSGLGQLFLVIILEGSLPIDSRSSILETKIWFFIIGKYVFLDLVLLLGLLLEKDWCWEDHRRILIEISGT